MNDAMSLGVHRLWKDMTIARANPQPGELLIDVAGGTGDLARRWRRRGSGVAARRGGAPPRAIVCDVNAAMLRAGRARGGGDGLAWAAGDAERLPFPDRSADAVTIGFGIRNVTDRAAALSEMRRVLKPGGRFLCLEFSRPTFAALEAAYRLWSDEAIPRLGEAIARDRDSYVYLVESIRRFPDQARFAREVEAAGFKRVSVANFAGGVVALHTGWRC
jgi:demethylmenaquinone methyltransferase/2-methoxy-6-polyprenyl-1,4-benzoquinol methylase